MYVLSMSEYMYVYLCIHKYKDKGLEIKAQTVNKGHLGQEESWW